VGTPSEFLKEVFGASTSAEIYLCSLPNADSRDVEPGEKHVLTRAPARILAFTEKWDHERRGLYFCVSPLRPGASRRAKETVAELNGLWADIDFKDLAEGTPPEGVDEALRGVFLPPSYIVASGNGRHCYWLFKESVEATPEAIAEIETLLKVLAEHLGGDPAVAQCAALMRLPGTHNTKNNSWKVVEVLSASSLRYELAELREWLTAYSAPVLHRKAKKPNGEAHGPWGDAAAQADRESAIDVESRLADMRFGGAGDTSIHTTQVSVTAALLERGMAAADVVSKVLQATRAAAGDAGAKWDWRREERDIERMCSSWLKKRPRGTEGEGVRLEDFVAYMQSHDYIFMPAGDFWPTTRINARLPPVKLFGKDGAPIIDPKTMAQKQIPASAWLAQHAPVEQLTWAPGEPQLIRHRLIGDGGWVDRKDVTVFNLYRPPRPRSGDAIKAGLWLAHVQRIYPGEADHIINWFAHRVQRPYEKVNHGLVLGGLQGIGKDTLLEPVKRAVGPWNFAEVTPQQMLGRFNGFAKSVVLRISEAKDMGEYDRYKFYAHLKSYLAAPPDVLRVDEKNLREYSVFNVCGAVLTTNHKTDGIYLPADDRRHFVAWSSTTKEDFAAAYWTDLWAWYEREGFGHVASYLAELDLSGFDPKAPPPKTAAFWAIVDAGRPAEDAELADIIDALGNPDAVTLATLLEKADGPICEWLDDRKNRRAIPYRLEQCGYSPVRNDVAKDGLFKIKGRRQVIYANDRLSLQDRFKAANSLCRSVR
jgi:Family of unknown function (DUF5906)/RepB DNA-primase from phage plasmid